jgi:hypothetical protein
MARSAVPGARTPAEPEPTFFRFGSSTEDYFNTAFCPSQEYCAPYSGISFQEHEDFSGKTSLYRFHIEDPVMFERSIRVTIEHGHANGLENDYASTAYWYQTEPHAPFEALPPVADRLPGLRRRGKG